MAIVSERLFGWGRPAGGVSAALLAVALSVRVLFLSAANVLPRRLRVLKLRWRSRITREGGAFILLTLLVAASAVYSGNNLVYLVLSSMLAAMIVSGLVSRLGLAGLELKLALPDHIFAARPAPARIAIRNLKRRLPSFSIHVGSGSGDGGRLRIERIYCPLLAAGEETVAFAEALFAERGAYRREIVGLTTSFPFRFVERRTRLELSEEIVVYPAVDPSDESERIVGLLEGSGLGRDPGDSHDLRTIRPALPGDGARFLDWKAAARTGELWVREFTREDRRRVVLELDRRAADAEEFERRVSLCAAVVWRLHALKAEIEFHSDLKTVVCAPDAAEVYEILHYLALVERIDPSAAPPGKADYVFGAAETSAAFEPSPRVKLD